MQKKNQPKFFFDAIQVIKHNTAKKSNCLTHLKLKLYRKNNNNKKHAENTRDSANQLAVCFYLSAFKHNGENFKSFCLQLGQRSSGVPVINLGLDSTSVSGYFITGSVSEFGCQNIDDTGGISHNITRELSLNDIQVLLFVMELSLTGVALIVLAHACAFSLTVGLCYGRNSVLKAVQRANRSVKEVPRLSAPSVPSFRGQLPVRHGLLRHVPTSHEVMNDKSCLFI